MKLYLELVISKAHYSISVFFSGSSLTCGIPSQSLSLSNSLFSFVTCYHFVFARGKRPTGL